MVACTIKILIVLMGMAVGIHALHQSSNHIRSKRQLSPEDEYLACLFQASIANEDPTTACQHLNNSCICVPYWQCLDNNIPGPETNLQPVVNLRLQGQVCSVTEHVCCIDIDRTAQPPTPEQPNGEYQSQCGRRNPDGFGATFQGFIDRQAQYGEFPWMAAVLTSQRHEGNNANFYVCGASLIHPRVVMTAAHYVQDKQAGDLMVRLGEWNFREQTEPQSHQDFFIERIEIHPKYNPSSFIYDVALLFLAGEVQLGPTVDLICLPQPNQDFSGAGCYSSGWGKDLFGETGKYQQILKSIDLPAVPNPACQAAMRTTRLGDRFRLHDSFMCAGGEPGKDTCTGDGGSPLVCPDPSNPSRYVQAGVVAWGIGCGQDGIPGVYAAVSRAVPWINQEIEKSHGFDPRIQG